MPTSENLKLTFDEFNQITGYRNVNEQETSLRIDYIFELSVLTYNALNKIFKCNKYDE